MRTFIVSVMMLFACGPTSDPPTSFDVIAVLDAGLNPHQIVFSDTGDRAYIAAAGSDRVTIVEVETLSVTGALIVPDAPLGVALLPGGGIAATRFGADQVVRFPPDGDVPNARVTTGGAPSLLAGPLPTGELLVAVEQSNLVWFLDPTKFVLTRSYDVGNRPFPPAATSDGRLVFVPNYDDGTVSVIDVWNERIVATTPVGANPSGGAVLPDDIEYAVAVRGEDKIVLINTASFEVVDSIVEGIGDEPFSVVVAPNGWLAFVNNTASHDVSVIDVVEKKVITRIPIGEQPIVMAVHPSGETLWVSSEGSDELTVLAIPDAWRAGHESAAREPTEVAVMGMIHGRHPTSELWGFEQLETTIRNFDPDIVCVEIPPNRWARAWRDYTERGVVEEARVVVFPEYNDFMFRLATDMGFEMIPCAAWTKEMNDLRRSQIEEFETAERFADEAAEYQRLRRAARAQYQPPGNPDDPYYIHSDAYDIATQAEYDVYDRYLNDWIGPGGWTNINIGHTRVIDRVIAENPGKRILVTFGAGHKYWFLKHLRDRDDVRLVDLVPYLP